MKFLNWILTRGHGNYSLGWNLNKKSSHKVKFNSDFNKRKQLRISDENIEKKTSINRSSYMFAQCGTYS